MDTDNATFLEKVSRIIQQFGDRLQAVELRRINQQMILPGAVKQRHIEGFIVFRGLDAAKPTNGDTEIQFWYSTDNNKFYAWNGTAWKSTTLA